uniref:Uncharacterized protein n=1 Tax=Nelumbo nucifera TaxID=4432 RepID=A0A822XBZ5_NELNU|nr:TPA_asm: hypothetical protein HUJ06_020397 [Nelumbo nucifera]
MSLLPRFRTGANVPPFKLVIFVLPRSPLQYLSLICSQIDYSFRYRLNRKSPSLGSLVGLYALFSWMTLELGHEN